MKNINLIKNIVISNKSVVENYFFMTILQVINSFFYLLIYPYLIRVLGETGYGIYVFATTISTFFLFFINFGLDLPATKAVAESNGDKNKIEEIFSIIFTAKTCLFTLCTLLFFVFLFTIPIFKDNMLIFILCYLPIYSFVLFPQWFFQGIQKMRIVTYIQLGVKFLSLPFIFFLVNNSDDLIIYVFIVSITTILGGLIAFYLIYTKYNLKIYWSDLVEIKKWLKFAQPFFYSSIAGSIKEYSIPIIVGSFFDMKDVAIYDLANKIIIVPRTLFMSVNAAIFPKLIVNLKKETVKKMIKIEALLSISVVLFIVLFGKYIVMLMGGEGMETAYYLSILLSTTIISWLVVGVYINFVFIPNEKNHFIAKNQIMALVAFFSACLGGLFICQNIIVFGFAMALSGIVEIFYCSYITRVNKFLV
ncbi:flippase [Flavobacterium columnare]|uniref:Flippase n=1 Tax=Flavobacterium columnare TaxID=996 RepID=A0A437UDR8_9FLAO|nr:oligosaccharide flippase family protein [Flavobacterium columnare]RVU91797.1 flippase [Flavobacterium columnare]